MRRLVRRVGVTAWSSASDRPRGAPGPRVSARRAGAALGSRGRERRRSRRLLQQLWRPRSRGVSCAPLFPSSQLGCGAAGQVLQDADGRVVVFRLGAPCSTASSLCEANPKSVSEHPSVSLQHPTRRSVVNTAHRPLLTSESWRRCGRRCRVDARQARDLRVAVAQLRQYLLRVLAQLGRHALDGAGGIGESSVGSNRTDGQARACHRIKQERVHSCL